MFLRRFPDVFWKFTGRNRCFRLKIRISNQKRYGIASKNPKKNCSKLDFQSKMTDFERLRHRVLGNIRNIRIRKWNVMKSSTKIWYLKGKTVRNRIFVQKTFRPNNRFRSKIIIFQYFRLKMAWKFDSSFWETVHFINRYLHKQLFWL